MLCPRTHYRSTQHIAAGGTRTKSYEIQSKSTKQELFTNTLKYEPNENEPTANSACEHFVAEVGSGKSKVVKGLRPGNTIDLVNGWDFSRRSHRKAVWNMIKGQDPDLVILSAHRADSPLKGFNSKDVQESERAKRSQHYEFCTDIAEWRQAQQRGFVFEKDRDCIPLKQPAAESRLLKRSNVFVLKNAGPSSEQSNIFVEKHVAGKLSVQVGLITNVIDIVEGIEKKPRTAPVQVNNGNFCKVSVRGLREHLHRRGIIPKPQFHTDAQLSPQENRTAFNTGEMFAEQIVKYLTQEHKLNLLFETQEAQLRAKVNRTSSYPLETIEEEDELEAEEPFDQRGEKTLAGRLTPSRWWPLQRVISKPTRF